MFPGRRAILSAQTAKSQKVYRPDGTCIRVYWDGLDVHFSGGRTDRAAIPSKLLQYLEQTFTSELFLEVHPKAIILFGEGYGGYIQESGPRYSKTESFMLFDAVYGTSGL